MICVLLNFLEFIYQNVLNKIRNSHQMFPCNSKSERIAKMVSCFRFPPVGSMNILIDPEKILNSRIPKRKKWALKKE